MADALRIAGSTVVTAALRLLARSPRPLRPLALAMGTSLLVRRNARGVQTLRANLAVLPGTNEDTVRTGVRTYLAYVLDHLALPIMPTATIASSVDVIGLEAARHAATSRPFVFVASHSGNWDHAAIALATRVGGLHALASSDPGLAPDSLIEMYGQHGITAMRSSARAVRAVADALRQGRDLLLLCDFVPDGARSIEVQVLGRQLEMPTVPFELAVEAGCPVVPLRVFYAANGRLQVEISHPIEPTGGLPARAQVRELAQEVGRLFGEHWTASPQDWHAYHQLAWGAPSVSL